MNEQLIVKNFGPIKDATVDFKRVTVFIGPTGGGKSTLAKLAAIWRQSEFVLSPPLTKATLFSDYAIKSFVHKDSVITWKDDDGSSYIDSEFHAEDENKKDNAVERTIAHLKSSDEKMNAFLETVKSFANEIRKLEPSKQNVAWSELPKDVFDIIKKPFLQMVSLTKPIYILSERIFLASLEYSWAGMMRDNIGLSKLLLDFANSFSLARKDVVELDIPFFNVKYMHIDGRDFIKVPEREEPLMLLETASGIQSVTPLLVLLEHLSRNTEQAQSFIIEEPELNLYPTAQQGLLNWLVEKCTKGENDLTITTHSPYILSSCNLLLEAYKVAKLRPDLEKEIATIVPKACWLNPDEFAAYYVADGTVKPITDDRTHLIGGNELDAVSGDISDSFRKLLRLKKQIA
jgi:predicted ATPase